MASNLTQIVGFEWDRGNQDKNWVKHRVTHGESEDVFFNSPLVVLDDPGHSESERRLAAFGKTESGRRLVVIFTVRKNRFRVISSRDMNRKERSFYESQDKKPA